MANYYSWVKERKRRADVGNKKNVMLPVRGRVAKTIIAKYAPRKLAIAKFEFFRERSTIERCVNLMGLDELLEASKVIEMGIKGEKIPVIKSPRARKYAGTTLCLNRRTVTKPMAEKMMHDLNVQIIEKNKKTIDAVESKRLYRELMAEE